MIKTNIFRNCCRKNPTLFHFLTLSFLSLLSMTVLNCLSSGNALNDILFGSNYYMDFYNSLCDASTRNVYDLGVIYPPMSCLLFYILAKTVPSDLSHAEFDHRNPLYSDGSASMQFLLYTVVVILLLGILVYAIMKRKFGSTASFLASFAVFISYPVIYGIQRGNTILLTLVLCLFFVFFRNSDNRAVRELSFLALAFAAALKIYPALFGLLLICDKKYRDAVRLMIYGILLFVLPFAFYGGVSGLVAFVKNNLFFSEDRSAYYSVNGTTFSSVLAWVALMFHVDLSTPVLIGRIFIYLALFFVFFFSKYEWKKHAAICFVFANTESLSGGYILCFLIISFLAYLSEANRKSKKINFLYSALFIALLVIIPCFFYPFTEQITAYIQSILALEKETVFYINKPNLVFNSFLILIFEAALFFDTLLPFSQKSAKTNKGIQTQTKQCRDTCLIEK